MSDVNPSGLAAQQNYREKLTQAEMLLNLDAKWEDFADLVRLQREAAELFGLNWLIKDVYR